MSYNWNLKTSLNKKSDDWDFSGDGDSDFDWGGEKAMTHKFIINHAGQVFSSPEPTHHEAIADQYNLHVQNFPHKMSLGALNDDGSTEWYQHDTPFSPQDLSQRLQGHFGHPVTIEPNLRPTTNEERWGIPPAGTPPLQDRRLQDRSYDQLQAEKARGGRPFGYYDNPYINRGGSTAENDWNWDFSPDGVKVYRQWSPRALPDGQYGVNPPAKSLTSAHDPMICPHDGGRMSEPRHLGRNLVQTCLKCGRTRHVDPDHPLVQQHGQQTEYPDMLNSVGPTRPWAVAKVSSGVPPVPPRPEQYWKAITSNNQHYLWPGDDKVAHDHYAQMRGLTPETYWGWDPYMGQWSDMQRQQPSTWNF